MPKTQKRKARAGESHAERLAAGLDHWRVYLEPVDAAAGKVVQEALGGASKGDAVRVALRFAATATPEVLRAFAAQKDESPAG